jgi:hypothetical protein
MSFLGQVRNIACLRDRAMVIARLFNPSYLEKTNTVTFLCRKQDKEPRITWQGAAFSFCRRADYSLCSVKISGVVG